MFTTIYAHTTIYFLVFTAKVRCHSCSKDLTKKLKVDLMKCLYYFCLTINFYLILILPIVSEKKVFVCQILQFRTTGEDGLIYLELQKEQSCNQQSIYWNSELGLATLMGIHIKN